jgi:hypothetical protein
MRFLKGFLLVIPLCFLFLLSSAQHDKGGYATMRVFDCNRSAGMGSGYISAKVIIVYEDSTVEQIPILSYSEKNELENLKTINQIINRLKSKGYFLIAQYTTGEQGNLVTDYTFLKQQ